MFPDELEVKDVNRGGHRDMFSPEASSGSWLEMAEGEGGGVSC